MTKEAAIHAFFSSFGLDAYLDAFLPTNGDSAPEYPYITYSLSADSDLGRVPITARVYYRSESWLDINEKVRSISQAVGQGHVIECDEGGIIIRKGTPFAQTYSDPSDDMVRGKILMFDILYATTF